MLKPSATTLQIKEQIINDLVTDLMLIFRVTSDGEAHIQLLGDNLPFGNRDFQFGKNGELVGTGTGLCPCKYKPDIEI